MAIKYSADAEKLIKPESDSPKINTPQKNYSGASVNGQFYGHVGRPMKAREHRRSQGRINRNNPLLKGLKSRSGKTGALMRRPFSVHSSNADVRAFAKYLEKENIKNGSAQTQG